MNLEQSSKVTIKCNSPTKGKSTLPMKSICQRSLGFSATNLFTGFTGGRDILDRWYLTSTLLTVSSETFSLSLSLMNLADLCFFSLFALTISNSCFLVNFLLFPPRLSLRASSPFSIKPFVNRLTVLREQSSSSAAWLLLSSFFSTLWITFF